MQPERKQDAECGEHRRSATGVIEEFEIKSYEYGIYSGEITPSEQDETNETNETCLPSTAQEEPLEVIELDDKVIYKLKDEA